MIAAPTDFREAARRRLPRFLFDYADGGSGTERTLAANADELAAIGLRQRVLGDVAAVDPATTLLGEQLRMPVVLAPVGLAGMYARRGEVQAARAADDAGVPFCLSSVSVCDVDEVSRAAAKPIWFQLYVIKDRGFMRDLLARAKAAGCRTLVFTVDMPVPGARYRDARSGMSGRHAPFRRMLQAIGRPGWSWDVGLRGRPHRLGNMVPVLGASSGLADYMGWLGTNFDPSIRWTDLGWIREAWPGSLVIKGVLDPDDARAAADLGADGIVVSNHGGRQLDGAPATARVLPAIAEAVRARLAVLVDSGVRTGTDVLRMLALGADAVMIGRAWLYALAAQGGAGVRRLLDLIERELRVAMTLTGVSSVAAINRSVLAQAG